jgi:ATP-dependent DNA helicase RecQ
VQTPFRRDIDKLEALAHDVPHAARRGQGIVYAATRRGVEGLVEDWASRGLRAEAYHAGMQKAERARVEAAFFDGGLDVVVATVAFGLGIDKPDVRWVYHADIPASLDEYYQEIGRSGRDGEPAEAVLYFRPDDLRIPRLFAASAGPSEETLLRVAAVLGRAGRRTTITAVQAAAELSRARAGAALQAFADAGAVRIGPRRRVSIVGDLEQAVTDAEAAVERRRTVERSRAETMEAYAETRSCRRRFILEYFGEEAPEHCGRCDNCERFAASDPPDEEGVPFARGSLVRHATFGVGEIIGYADGGVLVGFENAGYKRLDLGLVADGSLLEPA